MTRYYSHHHSAHNPPEVQARPPEQVQHLCAGRPAHQGDGKTITQILKTKTPEHQISGQYKIEINWLTGTELGKNF